MEKRTTFLFLLFTVLINSHNIFANDLVGYSSKIIVPPANDECSTATTLTVNQDNLCTSTESGTVSEATASSQAVICTGKENEANDDVWFKFVATSTSHKIELLNISGDNTNLYHATYDAGISGDCNALSLVLCSDPNSSIPTGLTIGNTYLVRVFTNSTGTHNTTFDICIGADPTPPVNDDCANAEVIASIPFSNTVDASTATNNAGFIDVSSCGSMNDGVWYTIVGDGNQLTVTVLPTGWDVEIGVYTGSCGTFTCVGSANVGISGTAEAVIFNSTLGETYYINVGHQNDSVDEQEGVFNISVTSTVLSIDDLIAKGFSYYPNPVKDELKLSANELIENLTVYNHMGQRIKSISPGLVRTSLDFSDIATGTYFVRAKVGTSSGSFKIIKE